MTTQEVIDALNKVEDKSLPVSFAHRVAGEKENGDTFDVGHIGVCQDCVVLDF